ncbi:hypothetical protein CAPTEDRAFT_107528 [Capitella teleta]|uniref:EF-hand domain-containing protein n=1 Tax=Capitella teleta TaxID=283909 RepID=X1YTY3_CAPTE|nr:hypothetical protein CAPTEDRAFT_107528 [Capitella teleta]|eukprot:ELT88403.1 hypothetical protein CAPTEDRAFT_107528 [Capitella teleta]
MYSQCHLLNRFCCPFPEYRDAFDLFDMDGDGTITVEEIYKVLQSLGRHTTKEEIEKILSGVDVDGHGSIEFPEFIQVMKKMQDEVDTEDDLIEVFRALDQDGDGLITKADLRQVVVRISSDLTNTDLEEMIREADKTGDGHIDFEGKRSIMA